MLCGGIGSFHWTALSGDPKGIYQTDTTVETLIVVGHEHLDLGLVASPNRKLKVWSLCVMVEVTLLSVLPVFFIMTRNRGNVQNKKA